MNNHHYNGSWLVARGLSVVKKSIKAVIRLMFSLFPSQDIILFESYPDFTDNTYPVYLKLNELLPGYKFFWFISPEDVSERHKAYNIIYPSGGGLWEMIRRYYYVASCRALIFCNRICANKFKNSQLSIYLDHGNKIKDIRGIYDVISKAIDYVNNTSPNFSQRDAEAANCPVSMIVCLGYPRCDYLYIHDRKPEINELCSGKYIIWLPTFRSTSGTRDDAPGSIFNTIGVPLFYSVESLISFNSFLKDKNIHILYKPHFAQNVDIVKKETLSNFHFIDDNDILGRNLQLYEVIAQSEALITDYSTVIWDYMLLDRPIAVTIDDIDSYRKGRGFAFKNVEDMYHETSEVLLKEDELRNFIVNVLAHRDIKQAGRRKWRDISNKYQDGHSAERVAKFVADKLGCKI